MQYNGAATLPNLLTGEKSYSKNFWLGRTKAPIFLHLQPPKTTRGLQILHSLSESQGGPRKLWCDLDSQIKFYVVGIADNAAEGSLGQLHLGTADQLLGGGERTTVWFYLWGV